MNPYNFSLLCFAFCSLLIGVLVYMKRNDSIGTLYFVFSVLISAWGLNIAILFNHEVSYETALFVSRVGNIAAVFGIVVWLNFVLAYTKKRGEYLKVLKTAYFTACFIALFGFTRFFIPNVDGAAGFKYYGRPGLIFHSFVLLYIVVTGFSAALLWKQSQGAGRNQPQTVRLFWASSLAFLCGAPTFLPIYGIACPQFALLLLPFYPFAVAYCIIRKNLFDEEDLAQAAHRDKLAAIGTIAASINHEIRNPLYIIHGMAESFLENFRGEHQNLAAVKQESVAVLERTAEQAKRAMDIMGQLSLFAKQKVSDSEAEPQVANLSVCLENVLPLVRHEMALEKIRFEKDIPENLLELKANPRQLEEILFNLIVNACQAMKPKGGRIRVSAKQSVNKVVIQIEDTGPGIPQDRLKQIFEPFYTTKEEGTGLGLYITRQLVEKSGGKITAISREGMGTAFSLEFQA